MPDNSDRYPTSLSVLKPSTNLTGKSGTPTSLAGHLSNADDQPLPPRSSSVCGGSALMKSGDLCADTRTKGVVLFAPIKSDPPHFANLRHGGKLDGGTPDILLIAFCFLIGVSMLGLCLGLAISIDPLGIVHAPYCPTEMC